MDSCRTAVTELLTSAMRAGLAPGLAAAWMRVGQGSPVTVAVGTADIGPPHVQTSVTTLWDLASLTKPLATATLVLIARRHGLLDLDWTVGRALPVFNGLPLGRRTILDLLTHTSGMPAWAPLYALAKGQRSQLLAILGELPLADAGRHVVYSCPGFVALGLIIEEILGGRLATLFAKGIARPFALDLTFTPESDLGVAGGAASPAAERQLVLEQGLDPRWIPKHNPGFPDDGNARFLGGVAGNAGLFGTVSSVASLASAYLPGGDVLTAEETALATQDHTPGLEQARGLGWQLASSPRCSAGSSLAPEAFGHTGFTGTSVWVDPSRGLVMVLCSNRNHPAHRGTDLHPLRRRFHDLVVRFAS
jgi:CubicO group peptidase (beta-lactamase class C family)